MIIFFSPPNLEAFIDSSKKEPVICDAILRKDPVQKQDSLSIDLDLISCKKNLKSDTIKINAGVRLFVQGDLQEQLFQNDYIRFRARLKSPRVYKNPGSFNYPLYLKTLGIDCVASVINTSWIAKLGFKNYFYFIEKISKARNYLDNIISNIEYDSNSKELIKTIAIGKRDGLTKEIRNVFSKTGIAHLLAISGLHIGYVAIFIYLIFRLLFCLFPWFLLKIPAQILSWICTIPFVWLYISLVDFPVSAERAGIMFTVFAIVFTSYKFCYDLLSALAFAIFLIILINPSSVFSISFQFSVVIVLFIILFAGKLKGFIDKYIPNKKSFVQRLIFRIVQAFSITIVATLASFPLVSYYFHYISGIGFFSNLIAIPFVGLFIIPVVILGMVISVFNFSLAILLFKISLFFVYILIQIALFFEQNLRFLIFSWSPTLFEVILFYLILAGILIWRYISYKKVLILLLTSLLIFDFGYWHMIPLINKKLIINFLDVGQGDSIFIRFPDGKNMLIDGGGIKASDFDIGENIITPFLLKNGIYRVDTLVLTHPHHDHYKGLGSIAKKFNPSVLYTNGATAPIEEIDDWNLFLEQIYDSKVIIMQLNKKNNEFSDTTLEYGQTKVDIYAPEKKDLNVFDENDTSLVVKITYKDRTFLFTGDLMKIGEKQLLDRGVDLKADVLKVGHHGSKTSSTKGFLDKVKPEIAIITVGQDNAYGVPDEEVMERLDSIGAKIYRTDQNGMITIKTDGKSLDIKTYK